MTRSDLKAQLLTAYGTITAAAQAAKIGETYLSAVLLGKKHLPLRRVPDLATAWGLKQEEVVTLCSAADRSGYDDLTRSNPI